MFESVLEIISKISGTLIPGLLDIKDNIAKPKSLIFLLILFGDLFGEYLILLYIFSPNKKISLKYLFISIIYIISTPTHNCDHKHFE